MHTLNVFRIVVLAVVLTAPRATGQYHGILINGKQGTQLYDPFNPPHAQGNLSLGLPKGSGGGAAINGQLAYFASGTGG
jgi:hypothetical protein